MREEKNGIRKLKPWEGVLIVIDFIIFYFTFFHTFWTWIDKNKGIPFTLFLFVTSWIIYLRLPKKEETNGKDN